MKNNWVFVSVNVRRTCLTTIVRLYGKGQLPSSLTSAKLSEPHSLNLSEAHLIVRAIVKFGRPRGLVSCDLLGVFDLATRIQIGGWGLEPTRPAA